MSTQRSRRDVIRASGGIGLTFVGGCIGDAGGTGGTPTDASGVSGTMTVFHAGSLAPPFTAAEEAIEAEHPIQVNREAKGSVGSTRKITDQGRSADVLGVSDFRLIRDMVLPGYASWYAIFATNAMTIAYTEESVGAGEVGPNNWWEVLTRDDVTFAHSDPAVDPNGYRTVMSMQLGATPLDGETLYDEETATRLIEQSVVPSGTETDLIGQLQSGALDYAWNYQSAGSSFDVRTVDLQPHVDLSRATVRYAEHYAKATVEAGGTTYTGAPITYGITVPSVAANAAAGRAWVASMITATGRGFLADNGFEPVTPAVVPARAEDAVPARVAAHTEARSSLGPLTL